ncbi:putative membrane protein, partial [Bacteroides fragilis str. 3988T(B)14]
MEHNNKRILKNTVFLYFRMFIIMILGFYTTRI